MPLQRLPAAPGSYPQRLACLSAACLLASAWLWQCRRLRPGAPRLAAALPVLALCLAAPLLFKRVPQTSRASEGHDAPFDSTGEKCYSDIITIVLVEFALTWLCSFKVLAWACGRGPLEGSWGPLQFAAILLAPITPVAAPASPPLASRHAPTAAAGNGRQGEHAGDAGKLALAFAAKAALVFVGLALLRLQLPLLLRELLYTLGLYAILSFVMDGPAALASGLIGVRVSPHFDRPWQATSVAQFWSRRWDLAASNALRYAVYDPLMEGRLVRMADKREHKKKQRHARGGTHAVHAVDAERRQLASAACFLVSGLMHELQFLYMTGSTSRGLMCAFFIVQVPLLAVERQMATRLRRAGLQAPAPLRTLLTLLTLLLVAHATFWAASHKGGVTQASVQSVSGSVQAARSWALALHAGLDLPGL